MSGTRIARLQQAIRDLTRNSARTAAADPQWLWSRVPECCWPCDRFGRTGVITSERKSERVQSTNPS
jgi:hypothetical protein